MRAIKQIVPSILLVLNIFTFAGCSLEQTAALHNEPIDQVTTRQQVDAYLAWVAWVRDARMKNPTLVCIRSHESANLPNPWAAYNPDGPYYGAYQFLQGTWNSAAEAVGRGDLVGLPPMEPYVAWYDQDEVTLAYHALVGDSPWGNMC